MCKRNVDDGDDLDGDDDHADYDDHIDDYGYDRIMMIVSMCHH